MHAGSSGGTHPFEAGLWRRARRHHQTPCVWLAARSRGFWRQRQCNRRCPPLYPVQDTCDGEARGITFASADPAWGRSTATRPCRETHRGLVGTPALTDCLWPVMDSQRVVTGGCKGSHALLPSLLTRFARSVRKGTPRDRLVEKLKHIRDRISNASKFQQWAFRRIQEYTEYKAAEHGIEVEKHCTQVTPELAQVWCWRGNQSFCPRVGDVEREQH